MILQTLTHCEFCKFFCHTLALARLVLHFAVTRIVLRITIKSSIENNSSTRIIHPINRYVDRFHIELIHDQLPLAVPCYDLLPVTEFTLVLDKLSLWVPPAPLS